MRRNQLIHLKETTSTNTNLKDLLQDKILDEWFTIYADFQNGGRGQRGNRWESDSGKNLLTSILLYPKHIQACDQFLISQIVSLAIKNVLDQYISHVSIKWPNDIYFEDKKIAGILIENALSMDSIQHSIVGIGLNINQDKFLSDAPNPISLKQITGADYDLKNILNQIIEKIQYYYQQSETDIRNLYKESLYRSKGYYLYSDNNDNFSAQIENVEDSGLLVLRQDDGSVRKFAFKEVKFIL